MATMHSIATQAVKKTGAPEAAVKWAYQAIGKEISFDAKELWPLWIDPDEDFGGIEDGPASFKKAVAAVRARNVAALTDELLVFGSELEGYLENAGESARSDGDDDRADETSAAQEALSALMYG